MKLSVGLVVKKIKIKNTCQFRRHKRQGFDPWVDALEVSLPENAHGQRDLGTYSPQGRKESDTTEASQHSTQHVQERITNAGFSVLRTRVCHVTWVLPWSKYQNAKE